jgi:hypothetical protein
VDPDEKAGTDAQGAVQDPAGDPSDTTGTPPGNNAGDPPNPAGGAQPGTQPPGALDEPKFSQRQLNGHIANAKREARAELERELEQARIQEAERRGDLQSVLDEIKPKYESQEQTIQQLQAKVSTYVEAEMKRLGEEIARWPEVVSKHDPGVENPEARTKWANENREIAEELLKAGTAPPPGNPPSPKPAGGAGPQALYDQTVKEMESSGRYTQV